MVDQRSDVKSREAKFRDDLQRVAAAACLFVASLLLLTQVPILPHSVSIVIAVASGALAYKAPLPGVIVMFALGLFGYVYQFGLPLPAIVVLAVLFLGVSLEATQPGSVLGISCGVIAAMLMTTGSYLLAVPIMIAVPLFRARGSKIGSTGAVLVFLALYLPLLVFSAPAGGTGPAVTEPVPLFGQTAFQHQSPPGSVDIDGIISGLSQSMARTAELKDIYLNRLAAYLPVFQPDTANGVLIILLGLFLGASIAVAFGVLAILRWFEGREIGTRSMLWISPGAAILGGGLLFIVLVYSMSGPFSYLSGPLPQLIASFLACAVVLGGVGSAIEYWLRTRDGMVVSQEEYVGLQPAIQAEVRAVGERIGKTVAICHGIDLMAEQIAIRKAEQDIALSATEVEHMGVDVIRDKAGVFKAEAQQLKRASAEITAKVRRYCDDRRQKYLEYVDEFKRFGYSIGEPLGELQTLSISSLEHDRLLDVQVRLNEMYRGAAERALSHSGEVQRLIRSELDPGLSSTGLEIGRNYFDQGAYAEALDALFGLLSGFDALVSRSLPQLDEKAASARQELRRVLRDAVIPTIDGMGDGAGVTRYAATVSMLEIASGSLARKVHLMELGRWIDLSRQLAGAAVSSVNDLWARLVALERDIEMKSPPGYNWGKDSVVGKQVEEALSGCEPDAGWPSVHERLVRTERALPVIENAAMVVGRYGRIHEFFINYVNIEYLMKEKLEQQGQIVVGDLPLRQSYAQQYLRLFWEHHRQDVLLDEETGRLLRREAEDRW